MVHEIMKTKFRVFTDSLVLTILILLIGFSIGFYVEYLRASSIANNYKQFEIDALDLKLQNYYYQIMDQASCSKAIEENLIFADKIYDIGIVIEKYESRNELTEDILFEKKKYVLLKNELWMNSILLKKKCGYPFHTIVYLYPQASSVLKDAEDSAIADTLKKIKEERGNEVILIPIAGDLGLDSVEMQKRIYNISYLPSVIIDETFVLKGYHSKEQIYLLLNKSQPLLK